MKQLVLISILSLTAPIALSIDRGPLLAEKKMETKRPKKTQELGKGIPGYVPDESQAACIAYIESQLGNKELFKAIEEGQRMAKQQTGQDFTLLQMIQIACHQMEMDNPSKFEHVFGKHTV